VRDDDEDERSPCLLEINYEAEPKIKREKSDQKTSFIAAARILLFAKTLSLALNHRF
jgi:hypothetical protein